MKEFFAKIAAWFGKTFSWLKESNRPKHLLAGFLISVVMGFCAGIAAGAAAEYKDWAYNGKSKGYKIFDKGSGWDWLDFAATAIGSLIGGIIWGVIIKSIL